jgi:hypothetical protein
MDRRISFALVLIYLISFFTAQCILCYNLIVNPLGKFEGLRLLFSCVLIGGVGGILYCFRGTYLNYCAKNQWSDQWIPWYIVRPLVSMICGGVSYVFLKAGLLVLEAQKESDATNLGFYALAFIAGMNVDNFISKIEELADATWGIKKSRASKDSSTNQ